MKRVQPILSTILCLTLVVAAQASATQSWRSIRTRHLFLISNTGERELREVAAWLELFHDAFSRLISRQVFSSSVPTIGIVFRSDKDFEPFKPLYKGKPSELAGFFQAGNDVNYIAISLEPGRGDRLNAAFHEYVHLYVEDNVPNAPLWLNEGLAEFYSTFELANGEAIVGAPIAGYLYLLRDTELLPISDLVAVNEASTHYHERDKRGVFYAESWALVHYLMMADNGQRQPQLARYLSLLAAGVSPENSFNMAFQTTFKGMEDELKAYIRRAAFSSLRASVGNRENYGAAETQVLSEAEADYYLGDLLLHIGRGAEAEKQFLAALGADPNLSLAHAALGMLRVREGQIDEARRHLQKAAASSQNHLVHYYYAYALSRQGLDKDGYVSTYPEDTLREMRAHLETSIRLAPKFVDAYHLLAFVNLVANDQLDQSVDLIKRAMRLEPDRQGLKLILAQLYRKQGDKESARQILEALARSDNQQLRAQAESLLTDSPGKTGSVPQLATGAGANVVSVGPPGGSSAGGMKIDTSELPPVNEVVANYVSALGGEDSLRKLSSRVTRGQARVPGEFSGVVFESYEKSPNKSATLVKAERGVLGQGFDGASGWIEAAPGGLSVLRGVELAELQRDSDFYAPLRLRENYARVTLLGRVKIGYREAYLVEATPLSGEPDRFYFATESGLLIRVDAIRSGWRGRALVVTYYDDWREVDGVRVPFRVTRSSPGFTIAFTVDEVKCNVAIDERVFTRAGKR